MSVVALVWSWLTWKAGRRLQRENTEIQHRLLEIEETREADRLRHRNKAHLFARFQQEPTTGYPQHGVFIYSAREGMIAHDVTMTLDGKPLGENELVGEVREVPTTLHPGVEIRCATVRPMGKKLTLEFIVRWSDESGDPGLIKVPLHT